MCFCVYRAYTKGVDVESEQVLDESIDAIPFRLSHRICSAYGHSKDNKVQNGEKGSFVDHGEVDYFVFPLIECGLIGSFQLSVFFVDKEKFENKYVRNNQALSRCIAGNENKKRMNNKYLSMKTDEYIQHQSMLHAMEAAENKNGDIDDEEEALYVDEDDYENDKWMDTENENEKTSLLPPAVVVVDGDEQKSENSKSKMSAFFDKIMESSTRKKVEFDDDDKLKMNKIGAFFGKKRDSPSRSTKDEHEEEEEENENEKEDKKEDDKGAPNKIGSFIGKMMESSSRNMGLLKAEMNKVKINIPRPTNLCVEILTESEVQIGWRSDKSLKEYDRDNNQSTKKFKFEVRSKRVLRLREHDENEDDNHHLDAVQMIEHRPIRMRETFGESMSFKDVESGKVYKFQVRIMDAVNTTFMSKWSGTLSVIVPGKDREHIHIDDEVLEDEEGINKDHKKMLEALKVEELRSLCSELMQKVTAQQTKLVQYEQENEEWKNKMDVLEKEKDVIMERLHTVQRSLRIKSNQCNENVGNVDAMQEHVTSVE